MVIPKPVKPHRITDVLKPYILQMRFTNQFLHAEVVHTPTATTACYASTREEELKVELRAAKKSTRDVAAAGKIGKLLGERLLKNEIPAVSVYLRPEQKYHGKIKALIDSVRESGVKLL